MKLALIDEVLEDPSASERDALCALALQAEIVGTSPEVLAFRHLNGRSRQAILTSVIKYAVAQVTRDREYKQRRRLKLLQVSPRLIAEEDAASARAALLASPASIAPRDIRRNEQTDNAYSQARDTLKVLDFAFALYDSWKIGNVALGDATKELLLVAADRDTRRADAHMKNAAFYAALAARLRPGQRVRDGIAISDAHSLRQDVYGEERDHPASEAA